MKEVNLKLPNPRRIGSKNQREVAKFLKRWTGWEFHSTPRSGGLHWKKDARVAGDIVPGMDYIDEFPFSVEAKRRAEKVRKSGLVRDQINLGDLILNWMGSKMWTYWMQCVRDAYSIKKLPMMFLRNRGMSKGVFYVFIPLKIGKIFEEKCGDIGMMHIPMLELSITTSDELSQYHISSMEVIKYLSAKCKVRKGWYEEVVGDYISSEDED